MNRYLFGRYVEEDLRLIRDYIAQDSPEAARRMMIRFVSAFRLLAGKPELGHTRRDLVAASLRFWPVGAYLVVYSAARTPIRIVAVVHGARNVPEFLNREQDRK